MILFLIILSLYLVAYLMVNRVLFVIRYMINKEWK